MSSVAKIWNHFWFRSKGPEDLALFRILFFVFGATFLFLAPDQQPPSFYQQSWDPISFYHLLPGPLNLTLVAQLKNLWYFFSLLAGLGIFYSLTSKTTAGLALFQLGYKYNFGYVFHSSHLFIMIALILSFSKADHAFALFPQRSTMSPSGEYRWPVQLIRTYVFYVLIYCGLQKLYFGDGLLWVFSESFYLRLFTSPFHPPVNQWILKQPLWVSQAFAFCALFVVEIIAPLMLLFKKLRPMALTIWLIFHFGVSLVFGIHTQFFSQVFCYLIFLPLYKYYSSLRLFRVR